jgi:hypothetical protein
MIMLLVEDPVFTGDKWRHTGFNLFFWATHFASARKIHRKKS